MAISVALRIEPVTKDLGELTVRRALPVKRRHSVGPFVFFDHMGPADFPPDTGMHVRAHPHIGLATITYLFAGEILHRDSLGFVQPIRPGAVNWMTAGRGIVHSEKVRDEVRETGQHLHGIQTWVALPANKEEIEPRFEHYPGDTIPATTAGGADIRVIIGSAYGLTSPVRTESDTLYVEIKLAAGASAAVPEAEELGIYVISGAVSMNAEKLAECELAILEDNATGTLQAESDAHLVLCGGAALDGPRTIWWNFVSSRRERIEKARRDWAEGRFDPVPGETDFIPLPD